MINNKKNLALISFLALANIIVFGVYGYLFYQIYDEQTKTDKALISLGTEMKREASVSEVSYLLAETVSEQKKINEYFVDIKGTSGFLEFLRDMGKEAGVDLRLNSVDVEGKDTLRVSFGATGSFTGLYMLTSLLQATPYPINITSFNMSSVHLKEVGKSGSRWSGSYEIRLLSFTNK